MFLNEEAFCLNTQFRFKKRQIKRENIMVLNGATEHEELALISVNGFDTVYESNAKSMPVFIFTDDDDIDNEDEIEDDESNYDEDEDDYEDEEELDEDDEDGDFNDEDEDFDDEDDEDWDDDE
jgi:hypothetical protein